jgi:hypothetical protein
VTLAEFVRARLDEDEAQARAAQDPRAPAAGERWQWVYTGGRHGYTGDGWTDEPVDFTRETGELIEGDGDDIWRVSLRSVDEYPTPYPDIGPLPHFVLHEVEELPPSTAVYIAGQDPARTLVRIAVYRWLLELGIPEVDRRLAAVWSDHPDYARLSGASIVDTTRAMRSP